MKRRIAVTFSWAALLAGYGWAAEPAPPVRPPGEAPEYMRPTEHGLRLTPNMARVMGREFARNALGRGYGLDEAAQKEAAEVFARRIMEMAHKHEARGRDFIEFAIETLMENHGRVPPDAGKKWAEMSRPLIGAFREMATGVAEDLRPLIPPDKQARFAADMLKFSLAIDMYEKKMERWSQGQIREGENPFEPQVEQDGQTGTPPAGEAPQVQGARRAAEGTLNWESTGRWEQYVRQAIDFYKLDEAQQRSAQAILEDIKARSRQIMTDEWRSKVLVNQTRQFLSHRGMQLWNTPWAWRMQREYEDLMKPIRELTRELQDRLEQLPTQEQRQAAEARVSQQFADRGWRE